ncbi:cytochrome c biogenesis protein CcdC [Paenibacillus campi]|uniref:CcdC family protein n=1 Tax=Paenibacillus campi TaxID=3106031 RepID=UPI002B0003DD|nr:MULTISPECIES: cytochrome c biogenesis protein CcdC [unclassified Paenibacillus]
MLQFSPSFLQIGSTVGLLVIALTAILVRSRTNHRPVNAKKILIPPLGMSTGFFMFVVPDFRVSWLWVVGAFLIGWFIFSYPLIRGTRFEHNGTDVVVQRSKSFLFILLGLLLIRLLLHRFIEHYITIPQTAGVFFILAFGTLLHWRLDMYRKYRAIREQVESGRSVG